MNEKPADYLLADSAAELERLRLQAQVWEPETKRWLDGLGVQLGWQYADLGCGIIGPLARRVGPTGRVIGLDGDPLPLAGARDYVPRHSFANAEIIEAMHLGQRCQRPPLTLFTPAFCWLRLGGTMSCCEK